MVWHYVRLKRIETQKTNYLVGQPIPGRNLQGFSLKFEVRRVTDLPARVFVAEAKQSFKDNWYNTEQQEKILKELWYHP